MKNERDSVVITGLGVVSPIGIGRQRFWTSLCQGQSGVRRIASFDPSPLPVQIAAEVPDFDPKAYVARKRLKVMCRDAQLGVAAAALACREAGVTPGAVDPNRMGIVLGADRICHPLDECEATYGHCMVDGRFHFDRWGTDGMAASFPLSFLRVLPNMIASHISITQDARGPNNTIHEAEVSSLLAVSEAARIIQRGAADVMLAGGASSQMNPFDCLRRCAMGILRPRQDDPALVMRPFDAEHDGQVWGEGAAIFVLENRRHAEARGADILARLATFAAACEPCQPNGKASRTALGRAMQTALDRAGLSAAELGHVNAHGLSAPGDDRIEACGLRQAAPATPVTAPKSYFGNLGAAGGAIEMAVSVLALVEGSVPPVLNYRTSDPACPLEVIRDAPLATREPALTVNCTWAGQAAAVLLAAE